MATSESVDCLPSCPPRRLAHGGHKTGPAGPKTLVKVVDQVGGEDVPAAAAQVVHRGGQLVLGHARDLVHAALVFGRPVDQAPLQAVPLEEVVRLLADAHQVRVPK